MSCIAIIPARGASKRLPRKNLYELFGKPFLGWVFDACKRSSFIEETYISSEDNEILDYAHRIGAKTILRPEELAQDHTPKIEAVRHADEWIYRELGMHPHMLFSVQANSPELLTRDMDRAFEKLIKHQLWEVTSVDQDLNQNGAFRLIRQHALYSRHLSAHLGVVQTDYLDIHDMSDIRSLKLRYREPNSFANRVERDIRYATEFEADEALAQKVNLDDFAISIEMLNWLKKNIKEGSTVLEFGSGVGTKELTKYYRVYSVEHDERWLHKAAASTYIHAPLVDYGTYEWYDRSVVANQIPEKFDVVIIDGPPNNPKTQHIGRSGLIHNLDLINKQVPIIFDDIQRSDEYNNMLEVANRLGRVYEKFDGWQKSFGIVGEPAKS